MKLYNNFVWETDHSFFSDLFSELVDSVPNWSQFPNHTFSLKTSFGLFLSHSYRLAHKTYSMDHLHDAFVSFIKLASINHRTQQTYVKDQPKYASEFRVLW